jgi:hypothetical protein
MARYTVCHGYMHAFTSEFDVFGDALGLYKLHRSRGVDSRVIGASAEEADENGDGRSDGLTDDEREQVEDVP